MTDSTEGLMWMRRIWVSLGAATLLFVSACGDDNKSNPTITTPNNANSTNNINNTNNTNNINNTNNTNNINNTNNTNNTNNASNNTVDPNCLVLDPTLGACDPLCQSGCGAGEHCIARQPMPNEAFEATCSVAGVQGQGVACGSDADCGFGFMCITLDGGEEQCRQYCRPGSDVVPQCPADFVCRPFLDELRIGVCDQPRDECSVFPDSCDDGQNCYDTPNGKRCADYNADGMADAACTNSTECNDRYRCVGVAGEAETCKRICDPTDVDICDPGSTCQMLNDADGAPLDWGACF